MYRYRRVLCCPYTRLSPKVDVSGALEGHVLTRRGFGITGSVVTALYTQSYNKEPMIVAANHIFCRGTSLELYQGSMIRDSLSKMGLFVYVKSISEM